MTVDTAGAAKNLIRDIITGESDWDDPAYGFSENGQVLTHTEAIFGLIDLLAQGQLSIPVGTSPDQPESEVA